MPAEISEMQVSESVFIEGDFIALIVFSILLPLWHLHLHDVEESHLPYPQGHDLSIPLT